MKNALTSVGVRICILIACASVVYTLYAAIDPEYTLNISERFLCAAAVILPLGCSAFLIAREMPNEEKKQRIYHIFFWILFVYYVIQMIYMLFFAREFSRQGANLLDGRYLDNLKIQWEYRCNLTPFQTIDLMMNAYANDMSSLANINIIGNIVAFMPFAFFLPKLFPSMNQTKKFIGIMTCLIISVEVIQFFTLSGTMDIDDFILNMAGTVFLFFLLKLPLCHRLMLSYKSVQNI